MAKFGLLLGFSLLLGLAFLRVSTALGEGNRGVGTFEIKKGNFSVKLTNYGAVVISVILPDSKGNLADVALGYDIAAQYASDTSNFGAIVGRVANRIAGAQFTLGGKTYKLIANDGNNTLHGGPKGFAKVTWSLKKRKAGKFPSITFAYRSFDGEEGFPGDLDVSVTYKIVGDYDLKVVMRAKALNKATPVNLAQHTYWNLGGHNSGDILSNTLQLFASRYTPVDKSLIPTGKILPVKATPFDFLTPDTIGHKIGQLAGGYDINYVVDPPGPKGKLKKVAYLKDNKSGRALELWANAPGVQLYTSNTLTAVGKGGFEYKPHAAVCLETQGFPDSVNHPNFPSQIVYPGKTYKHDMLFKFSFH